ncbi:unnamed protein product [Ranitomeya imitator]|uniref:ribonuclease H n=1 Tax=Ranitomeya imitator TaxID=111125 RepID=A0ABN9LE97_9NEOB|nr:unnamed protein product [Ranitomeya imitator]
MTSSESTWIKFLIVYLDDILVFSDDWESHVKQVRMVFQVLRANSLFVKGSKCLFGVQKVSFLGFIFSPSTIEMDPVKFQAIYDWTQPTSLKSLQKFLGFANFYCRFICNFSSIAKPLTDLTKKGADVVNWSSAAVEAFQKLKCRFSSAPVLCQPDVSLPFQVEVDASEIGAGAVLSQRGADCSVMKPCAFFSRKFSPAERNYDVGNRELLAMKWAFEEWHHWLEGAKHRVVVLTDHKNLTYLESAKRLNPRQARWSLFFSRFDFVVSYLPDSKNVKADALSRSFVPDSPGLPEPAGQVESSDCPGVDTVVDRLQRIWTHVVDNLTLSQEKAQRFANRRRCVGPRLRVGDLVWLSSRYIPMKVSSPKFKPRFIGPYRISEVLNPVSFHLTLPDSFSIHNVFHRSLLRRYVAPVVPSVDPPAQVLVEGELEYIVEKIWDSRVSRRKLQYLVKWKGYGQEDNSWVFASDVHAADLVCAFHMAHPGRPGGSARLFYTQFQMLLCKWNRQQMEIIGNYQDTLNKGVVLQVGDEWKLVCIFNCDFVLEIKIIYTIRGPKDVAVSLYYFSKMSAFLHDSENMDCFLKRFLTDNMPYGSWFNHVKGWMGLLGKDNFMFQTYEDLKKDLRGSVIKICKFIGKELDDEAVDSVVKHASFKNMKQNNMANYTFVPHAYMDPEKSQFFRKGKN